MWSEGLIHANFGNMSTRCEGGLSITRAGAYLDDPGDPVFVPLTGDVDPRASSEYRVHREIYRATLHCAMIHAHPPCAVALSLLTDEIVPEDSEGRLLCPRIPVVVGGPGTGELASAVASVLVSAPVAMARGHGTFAAAKTLEQAYLLTAAVEHACCILFLRGSQG
ncbi:MAG: class II aldolase/adducin family protein [Methanomicrobiaceae archaeon]|nr:class II aldolase/adducin family protein [Methanomicrobiaceae archaeon]